jgi:hypothetical protein
MIESSRRDFLRDSFCGFGSLALLSLLHEEHARAGDPLAPRPPHHPAKARNVIFLYMAGGPSHIDTFDPKPLLNRLHGQRRPAEFGEARYQFISPDARLLGSARQFTRHGQSGTAISDLFSNVARHADDLAVLRSCYGDRVVHSAAQYELFTGRTVPGFPSMGAWTVYGLGTEGRTLPAYIVMPDPAGALEAGQPMYLHGFLPAVYQPTIFRSGPQPVRNLGLPPGVTAAQRGETVRLIDSLNRATLRPDDEELNARIRAYELAFRMQTEAPEIFDLGRETAETRRQYGIDVQPTDDYGRRCLLARRLVENGVRFVVVVSGGGAAAQQWDAHTDIEENHVRMARKVDVPIAALLADLKRRGLFDSTLVLWGGEFGRSPEAQGGRGRDHHNLGFSMWMAGGGIRGGQIVGATDAIGLQAIEEPVHFRDIHTTILHQLGLDQDRLTYLHLGREERLTLVQGRVIEKVVH